MAGQYYDDETGLHYNYHRYYDPATGRYITPDPIGLEGGINVYIYVSNNPFNLSDPLGLAEYVVTWNMQSASRGIGLMVIQGTVIDPTPRSDGNYTAMNFEGIFGGVSGKSLPFSFGTFVAKFEDNLPQADLYNIEGWGKIITSCSGMLGNNSFTLGSHTSFGNLILKEVLHIKKAVGVDPGSRFEGKTEAANKSFVIPKDSFDEILNGFN